MSLAKKMLFKPGTTATMIGKPDYVTLDDIVETVDDQSADVILFVHTLADVDLQASHVHEALRTGRDAWISDPKAGKLDTDLNRDILYRHAGLVRRIAGSRQISIDHT
ncbi:MAG: hypothetical protein EXR45_06090 [Chloroflexi bacterium]|nr:hypothetical protein [Chloroflexota bacterium]